MSNVVWALRPFLCAPSVTWYDHKEAGGTGSEPLDTSSVSSIPVPGHSQYPLGGRGARGCMKDANSENCAESCGFPGLLLWI